MLPTQKSVLLLGCGPQELEVYRLSLLRHGYLVQWADRLESSRDGTSPVCCVLFTGAESDIELAINSCRSHKMDRPAHEQLPPLVVIGPRDDLELRLACHRAGAACYLRAPVDPDVLVQTVQNIDPDRQKVPYRVLLVDDDQTLLALHAAMLRSAGMEVRSLSDPMRILDLLDQFEPDVLVLDVYMPQIQGPEIAAVVCSRATQQGRDLPMLFLSAETDVSQQMRILGSGGDDFLTKPVHKDLFVAAVTARARRARRNNAVQQRLQRVVYEQQREHQAINAHAIVSVADASGTITYVNERFCAISGYSAEELLGQNHRIVRSSEHPPSFYQQLWETIASGRVWHGEVCNRRKDGSLYWVESTIVPFLDAAGMPYQYVSIRTDITHIKQVERELWQSQERLRRGQIYANIGTWDWNVQTGDLFWTERIGPLFGYPEGALETSYENFLAAVHPDDRQAVIDAVNACLERDVPYEIEHRVVWPDGTVRWLLERGAVVRDAQGRPLQMLGVVQDVHDRKQAEIALAERERQLLQAQELAQLGNWTANILTGELYWSDQIYRIFGYEPGSFRPSVSAFWEAVHPDDRELVRASERDAAETGRHDVVHRIVRPDGSIRYVHELAQAEKDESGRVIRLAGTVQDVTERILAQRRLSESEERFAFAVEGAGDGVWDWNIVTGAMPVSGHYESMLGYAQGELEPTVDGAWRSLVHPDDLPRVQDLLNEYLQGRQTHYAPELRLRCKDGSYKWILCRGTVVERDGKGQPVRMIGIHSDISERKQAEVALVEAREAAEKASRAKSEFLSGMSHELRTPMNAVLGFAQLLESDESLGEDKRDSVREILKAGRHLLALINEVLDLARIESGRLELSSEPVELQPLIDECLGLIRPLAAKRSIELVCLDGLDVVLRADRLRLKQVLLNLLSNAVKYNRDGGRVLLSARSVDGKRVRIEVEDTGVGIDRDQLSDLFEPFRRLGHEHSRVEGTGIGLTITRRLVEMMSGRIGVQSQLGQGSVFWFELPANELGIAGDDEGPRQSVSGAEPATTQRAAVRRKVLYIEDNPANVKLMQHITARRDDVQLLVAQTPEEGIELALSEQPELILLDIHLPGMSGYDVLEILRASPALARIPVVAVTANAMEQDRQRGLQAGFRCYLTKPLDVGVVHKVLDMAFKGGSI